MVSIMFLTLVFSSLKLMFSYSMMTCLISIEVMMTSIIMIMLSINVLWDHSYILLITVCLIVCEGSIGLSILSSLNKFKGNKYMYIN